MGKHGVLVGINYSGTNMSLKGPKNDVENIRKMLVNKYGYSDNMIYTMTDDVKKDNPRHPSKSNIVNAFGSMVDKSVRGDDLILFYSGHGVSTGAKSLECIYAADSNKRGNLLCGPEMAEVVGRLPEGVNLTIILDSCHSETIVLLPYTVTSRGSKEFVLEQTGEPERGLGQVNCFAASLTEQLSYDLDTGSSSNKSGGIFTKKLIDITNKNPKINFLDLLQEMRDSTLSYKQSPSMSFNRIVDLNQYFMNS